MQIMFRPEENPFDTCLFEETDDEETESSAQGTGPEGHNLGGALL